MPICVETSEIHTYQHQPPEWIQSLLKNLRMSPSAKTPKPCRIQPGTWELIKNNFIIWCWNKVLFKLTFFSDKFVIWAVPSREMPWSCWSLRWTKSLSHHRHHRCRSRLSHLVWKTFWRTYLCPSAFHGTESDPYGRGVDPLSVTETSYASCLCPSPLISIATFTRDKRIVWRSDSSEYYIVKLSAIILG